MTDVSDTQSDVFGEIDQLVDQTHGDGGREIVPEASSNPVKHFGFSTQPFSDNVNPEFFFRTEAHEEVFCAMKRCIEQHVSLGLTTAISGTGKTLLTQVLLQELDPRLYRPALLLAYPGMSRSALLREIIAELKIEGLPKRPTTHTMISAIQAHIIDLYLKGLRLVLIIDEVHFLGADALHILRTLSNIEVPERKLVTVLLFGEQSFMDKLSQPAFRSVFSRMFARAEIRPLHKAELQQYVKFRLLMAGGRPGVFEASAFDPLLEISGGIPREINRLCHNALQMAARMKRQSVTAETFEALKQYKFI